MCCVPPPSATAITDATPLSFELPAVTRKKLTVDFDGGNQSSDTGLLLLCGAEEKSGIVARLAAAFRDRCNPARIQRRLGEIIAARVLGFDHDGLRHDPVMKMAVGRCLETGAPLAS